MGGYEVDGSFFSVLFTFAYEMAPLLVFFSTCSASVLYLCLSLSTSFVFVSVLLSPHPSVTLCIAL